MLSFTRIVYLHEYNAVITTAIHYFPPRNRVKQYASKYKTVDLCLPRRAVHCRAPDSVAQIRVVAQKTSIIWAFFFLLYYFIFFFFLFFLSEVVGRQKNTREQWPFRNVVISVITRIKSHLRKLRYTKHCARCCFLYGARQNVSLSTRKFVIIWTNENSNT